MTTPLHLTLLDAPFLVARLPPAAALPAALVDAPWVFTARTDEEFSVVCPAANARVLEEACAELDDVLKSEPDWRAIKVAGPLDFALLGILARLTGALAGAGVSVFAISTFDTDYLLVKASALGDACLALTAAGCSIDR